MTMHEQAAPSRNGGVTKQLARAIGWMGLALGLGGASGARTGGEVPKPGAPDAGTDDGTRLPTLRSRILDAPVRGRVAHALATLAGIVLALFGRRARPT